jgi:hypothetical protein
MECSCYCILLEYFPVAIVRLLQEYIHIVSEEELVQRKDFWKILSNVESHAELSQIIEKGHIICHFPIGVPRVYHENHHVISVSTSVFPNLWLFLNIVVDEERTVYQLDINRSWQDFNNVCCSLQTKCMNSMNIKNRI